MAKKQRSIYEIKIKGLEDLKSLNKEVQNLNKKYDGLKKGSEGASKSTKGVGDSAKSSALGLSKFTKGAIAAGAALVAFNKISKMLSNQVKEGIQVFKGFEFEMAKVKAISGATNDEFGKLNKSAQELGRSTFFTAKEVASLQLNFSKLGFTATEVLQAQEAALLTATATGEDLARTATVIGSTIRGFGLDASESSRVADVMAASFTSSALTLEKFQTSMTKVSPVAKLLGIDLEETTAIMGVLTDAGIEASIAGTSLRNIFLKLGDPSSDLAKSIGFTVNSGEEMVRQFRRMRDEGINVEKMLKVVDVRQVAAISTMIEHIDKIEAQTESFRISAGAASDMADIIGATLEGSVKRLQSALDGLRIVLVEKIAPFLTDLANNFAQLFNNIAKLSETSLSEQLDKDRIKMNNLAIAASKLTVGTDERKKAIQRLQRLYPEYFSSLDAEKTKNDELKKSVASANEQLLKRIALRQKEDELDDVLSKAAEERNKREELQNAFTAEATDIIENYNLQIDQFGKTSTEVFKEVKRALIDRGLIAEDGELLTFETKDAGFTSAQLLLKSLSNFSVGATAAQNEFEKLQKQSQEILKEAEDFAKEFGLTLGQDGEDTTITPASGGDSTIIEDDEDPALKELAEAEFELRKQMLLDNQAFADGEIRTREQLNDFLLNTQMLHLQDMLEIEGLQFEKRVEIMEKLAQVEGKLRDQNLKKTEETEKAKSDLIKANIENAMSIGSSLMQIGELMGENSKAAKAGIAITKAASVASAIKGIIDAKASITNQAKSGDPFSAFARMAIMAAAVAPLIASLLALKNSAGGGGGGGEPRQFRFESDLETFSHGGLTKGGVFVGNSHANGGVKFAVGGRVMEAEGGEAIINKKSTTMFKPMLSAINSYNGNGVKFADGGLLNSGEKFALGGQLMSAQQLVSGGSSAANVLIVESDVTDVQSRISTIESQASF